MPGPEEFLQQPNSPQVEQPLGQDHQRQVTKQLQGPSRLYYRQQTKSRCLVVTLYCPPHQPLRLAIRPTTIYNSTTNHGTVVKSSPHAQLVTIAIQVIGLLAGCFPVVT